MDPDMTRRTFSSHERLLAGIGAEFDTAPVKYMTAMDLDKDVNSNSLDRFTEPVALERDKRVRTRSGRKGVLTGKQREDAAFVRRNGGACATCRLRKVKCEHAFTQSDTISSPSNDSSVFTTGQENDQETQPASLPVAESGTGSRLSEEKEQPVDFKLEDADIDPSLLESEGGKALLPIVPQGHEFPSSKADGDDAKPSATNLKMKIAETHHVLMTRLMRRVHATLASDVECAPSSGACRPNREQGTKRQGNKRKRVKGPGEDRDSDRGSRSSSRDEDSNGEQSQHQDEKSKSERRLACPFYKLNPRKYCQNSTTGKKYKTCGAAPGFEDIRRLKQHLRSAAHRMPPKCNNCGHQDDLEGAIDRMQLSLMKYGITWEGVFAILFPGDEPIPEKYFEDLSTGSSMSPSGVDTEFLQRIHANLRGWVEHDFNQQFIDEHIRACRPQLESGPHIDDDSMLPQPNLSDWPPMQPLDHGTQPRENPQLRGTGPLASQIGYLQPSVIGATAFPLDPTASTANCSYDTHLQNSQPSMSDFTGLTCHCPCHHHPLELCLCFRDCSFYKEPTDALLG